MSQVVVLDAISDDIFVCGVCKSVFNSLQLFLDHKRSQCRQLGGEYLTNINITDLHVPTSTGSLEGVSIPTHNGTELQTQNGEMWSEEMSCTICRKKFKNKKGLLAHMKSHYGKSYQCPICGRGFVQNSHLQRHILSHKVWPDSLTETTAKNCVAELLSYTCPFCNFIFTSYIQFRAHLKVHISLKKFKCIQGDCTEFYDSFEDLVCHVSSAHSNKKYICHICNDPFDSLESIAIHQKVHNEFGNNIPRIQNFKCLKCDASFRKPEKLSLHMRTESHTKVCIHCKKSFTSDKRLRLHLQIHRQIKPYQCNICDSSFHMKKYLSNHMLKHGKGEFKCTVCKNMFKRQDLLQRHMNLHQPNKKYKCPFKDTLDCKREFSRSDKLKLHIKCHTKQLTSHANIKPNLANNEVNNDTILPLLPI